LTNFKEQATRHLEFYWHSADDSEKIVLSVAASLQDPRNEHRRRSWIKELERIYQRSEPALRALERRGLLVGDGHTPVVFSTVFADWILSEVRAGPREQQSYQEWLASHANGMRNLPERARAQLTEVLPRIDPQYRDMFVELGTDPRVVGAVLELLKGAL
jgi:hypothetical protein